MTRRTTTEAELREWVTQGKTHAEIARLLGRHMSHVASACSVLGIHGKMGRRSGAHDLSGYLTGMRAGMTLAEIATKHGEKAGSVFMALRRAGLPTTARKLLAAEAAKQAA